MDKPTQTNKPYRWFASVSGCDWQVLAQAGERQEARARERVKDL